MKLDQKQPRLAALPWPELARAVADGLEVQSGESVSVFLTDAGSFPVVEAFCTEVYRRGAVPHVILTDERVDAAAIRYSAPEVLERAPAIEAESMRLAQVHVSFRGMLPPLPGEMSDPARVAAQRKAKGAISAMRWAQTRWAIVRVPTIEWAELIGISAEALFAEFFDGCLLDWSEVRAPWDRLAERLSAGRSVRIVSDDTDLTLGIKGRRAVTFAGEANWPDGEVATAPLDCEVDGQITFPGPFYFAAQRIEGLNIIFENGVATRVRAIEGENFAKALLATDDGSRRVGELGIGLNAAMQTTTGDLLFDEKILGTVHIALGRAYPECGGTNQSSLHWDIVKDLRSSSPSGAGSLYLDGQPLLLDGVPQWS